MRSQKRLWAWAALIAACADGPSALPEPVSFTPLSADVWSGTQLTLRSAGFVGLDPTAVLLGADTLVFARVDDSTLTVMLPDRPGTHQLRVVSPLVLPMEVPVHLNGFLDAPAGPLLSGRVVRGAHPAEVFGSGPRGLRHWNVSTGQTFDYPDSMHVPSCATGVGEGPHLGELVLFTNGCDAPWRVWRMQPIVAPLDTVPISPFSFIDVLGSGTYIWQGGPVFWIAGCDTACVFQTTRGGAGFDVVHSSRGDRAVPLAYTVSDSGAPVVDVAAGRVGYFVPPFGSLTGAAFSEEGDTLYLAGQDHPATVGGPALLVAVRASDGLQIAAETLSYSPCAVAVDPVRPWLFVAGTYREAPDYWDVLGVFDRATLTSIVTLRVFGGLGFGGQCKILPSPVERRLYVIETFPGFDASARARVTRFQTPP